MIAAALRPPMPVPAARQPIRRPPRPRCRVVPAPPACAGPPVMESQARIAALEAENRRAFDEAQREADALFAQYQLSQILASGGSPADLGRTVVLELTRLANADAGAIWLGEADEAGLALVATTGELDDLPPRLASANEARLLGAERPDLRIVVLAEDPPAAVLAFRAAPGQEIDGDGVRIAQLARHELAGAFAGARLTGPVGRGRPALGARVAE